MEIKNSCVAGATPVGAVTGGLATELPVVRVVALDPAVRREVEIAGEPMGDLMYSWAAAFARGDEPSAQDIARVARGEWMYRILRFSISLRDPPVNMRMSVHTHYALHNVKRGYLYPSDFPVAFRETAFEGAYKATLTNYYYQVAVATLPGDRLFIHLYSRRPFRGELRILYW
jgi:hypothetical protein